MIYIVLLIIAALIVAWFTSRGGSEEDTSEIKEVADDCCGAHEVCEADSLLSASVAIEYYNDEELDCFTDCKSPSYSDSDIEEFRDVLYTLKESEVAGWLRSMQLRRIELPLVIREEALMIVEERRSMAD